MKAYLFLILLVFLSPLVMAFDVSEFDFTYAKLINYSEIATVNDTEHFGGYTVATLYTYFKGLYDLIYAPIIEPLSLHLNQDNWNNDPNDWITWESSDTITFNESKLATTYYNATQSDATAGTIDGGALIDTQHPDGNYDGVTFNFSEASGSPGLDMRINFTGVTDFNKGYMRYKTSSLSGDAPAIELWDYVDEEWEGGYGYVYESTNDFFTLSGDVLDSTDHIQDGVVQMRLYKSANGNTQNHYYVDMLAIVDGYATPSGNVDLKPYWRAGDTEEDGNFTTTGNVTAKYFFGDVSSNLIKVDHIAEKTTGHNVVFDNRIDMGGNAINGLDIIQTRTIGNDFQFDDTFSGFYPRTVAYSLGISAYKWEDLWLSGDANVGGDALVTGWVNASNFNGTYYGDGSNLDGVSGGVNDTNINITSLEVSGFDNDASPQYNNIIRGRTRIEYSPTGIPNEVSLPSNIPALQIMTIYDDTVTATNGINMWSTILRKDTSSSTRSAFNFQGFCIINTTFDLTSGASCDGGRWGSRVYTGAGAGQTDVEKIIGTSTLNLVANTWAIQTLVVDNAYLFWAEGNKIRDADATLNNAYSFYGTSNIADNSGTIHNETHIWLEDLDDGDENQRAIVIDSDDDGIHFGADQDAKIYYDGTNLIFDYNTTNPDAVAWFSGNTSAVSYDTRTSVFDSELNAFDYIKDSEDYKDIDESIIHNRFYGYKTYQITDYSKPEQEELCVMELDEDGNDVEYCRMITIYPYTKIEEGVSLNMEIDVLRQGTYELKEENNAKDIIIADLIKRIEKLENLLAPQL